MTLRYGALAVTLLLAACGNSPASSSTSADRAVQEQAIRRTVADLETRINNGDVGFVSVFTDDAVIAGADAADVRGIQNIRPLYADLMARATLAVHFSIEEVEVRDDLAYERGTYTLRISDKASGQVLQDATNRHLHVLRRQPDGSWKIWRMMTNSATPPPAPAK